MDAALALNIPVVEQRMGRRDGWHDSTVGITPPQDLKGSRDRTCVVSSPEQKVESSSRAIEGGTRISLGVDTEQAVKPAEDRIPREKPHTPAFSEYHFRRKTAELIAHLNKLRNNLLNPEGAAIMTSFRRSLEQIWHVAGALPREKIIIVSAVEEEVRNKKWRELTIGQVDVLEHVLSNVNIGAEHSTNELSRAFSAIHRSQIDFYPSAAEDFDDEETETIE